ncbi:MAG: bifunctional phosphoglucose/phosphomannose isomerase [Candidatus Thermoplasmatota archaeon]|nr:bifunctional phosphoglucose/phosphomannose isomerase [Candidatus Thermoplasmatota archaeon]MDI6887581.1 bifunctional phosphoglucose/phosphomannose isomerase [Candidatus Thermoplasmatota archaeon]
MLSSIFMGEANEYTRSCRRQFRSIQKFDKFRFIDKLKAFPEQVENAYNIELPKLPEFKFDNIVVTGMGGSAIGGELLSAWALRELGRIIFVSRDYELPNFVDKNSLVFAISYSGNTEETLNAFSEALARKCKIIAVTSNGRLAKLALQHEIPLVKIPKDYQPRQAIAYLLLPIARILERFGIVKFGTEDAVSTLRNLRANLIPENEANNISKELALKLKNKIPIVYGHSYLYPVARRWKTQLNENSKVIAFASSFPEMCHNEIVGLNKDKNTNRFFHIILRSADENEQLSKKIGITKKLVLKNSAEVYAQGNSTISKMLSLIYIGDFTSYYLALLRKVDPTPVEIIEKLKKLL